MAPSVGNRHWDSAPSAHLVVLEDGGRIDLTTPRIRGTGSLGGGGIFPFTGPHGFSCIDRMEWSTGYLRGLWCAAGAQRAGGRGNAAKQQLTTHRWEWEGGRGKRRTGQSFDE